MAVRAVCVCIGVGWGGVAYFYKVVRNHLKTQLFCAVQRCCRLNLLQGKMIHVRKRSEVGKKKILRIDVQQKNHGNIK